MKNSDLFPLYAGLEAVSNIGGARFAYGVSKNKKILLDELRTIEETNKPTEAYQVFEKERIALCEKMANKNEKGEPKIVGNTYDIPNLKKFNAELDKLKEGHKEAVDEMQKKNEDYKTLLDQDATVEFFKIKEETIPETMTAKLLDPIMAVIE